MAHFPKKEIFTKNSYPMVYNRQLVQAFTPFAAKYLAATMLGPRPAVGTKRGRSYSMTMTKTKRRKTYGKKSFKDKMYDSMAAKHASGQQGVGMTHNTIYTLVPTALPTQGDSNSSRDGDSIVLCALKLNGFYNTASETGAYAFRVIVGYSGEEYTNTSFGSGIGSSEIFLPNTAGTITSNGIVNAKAFTVLHDQKFTLNSEIASARTRADYEIYVPLDNQMFYYQSSASALGKNKNLIVAIMADETVGSSGLTDVGGTSISWDFIYKNSN